MFVAAFSSYPHFSPSFSKALRSALYDSVLKQPHLEGLLIWLVPCISGSHFITLQPHSSITKFPLFS